MSGDRTRADKGHEERVVNLGGGGGGGGRRVSGLPKQTAGRGISTCMKGHREREWSPWGKWCSLLGTQEVPSPGEGELALDLPLSFPLGHLTG